MDWIVNSIKAVPVFISPDKIRDDSQQTQDFATVNTGQITYYDDDGGELDELTPQIDHSYTELPLFRPYSTPGCYNITLDEFRNSKLYCQNEWHKDSRFALTNTVNLTNHLERIKNDGDWLEQRTLVDQTMSLLQSASLTSDNVPELLTKKNVSLLPDSKSDADPTHFKTVLDKSVRHSYKMAATDRNRYSQLPSSSYLASLASAGQGVSNLSTPAKNNTPGGTYNNTLGSTYNNSPGGGFQNTPTGTNINTSGGDHTKLPHLVAVMHSCPDQ